MIKGRLSSIIRKIGQCSLRSQRSNNHYKRTVPKLLPPYLLKFSTNVDELWQDEINMCLEFVYLCDGGLRSVSAFQFLKCYLTRVTFWWSFPLIHRPSRFSCQILIELVNNILRYVDVSVPDYFCSRVSPFFQLSWNSNIPLFKRGRHHSDFVGYFEI